MPSRELETAKLLALMAGKAIMDVYSTEFLTEQKLGADDMYEPVTEADRIASQIIVKGLTATFPADAILSEEERDDVETRIGAKRVWIIDPIDGTAGFVKRDGDFAVQIGLAESGVPILGVVYEPAHNVLTFAVKGDGAFTLRGGQVPRRLTVSSRCHMDELTLAMSRNHPSPKMGKVVKALGIKNMIRRGSVGVKAGLISDRICDVYIHPGPRTKIWDTCAPQLILEEAGGKFTDIFGLPLKYDRADLQNRNGILASNGACHNMVVEQLKPVLEELGRTPYEPNI
ncbi:MAG: 3'(2'),5'-bisphosphate nucleotidase CysQ [Acidobacteria bacterium]|nr:3'(2'),5'-bisphosphate nucleotidase CysQ [Acidobacteriota bacterium]